MIMCPRKLESPVQLRLVIIINGCCYFEPYRDFCFHSNYIHRASAPLPWPPSAVDQCYCPQWVAFIHQLALCLFSLGMSASEEKHCPSSLMTAHSKITKPHRSKVLRKHVLNKWVNMKRYTQRHWCMLQPCLFSSNRIIIKHIDSVRLNHVVACVTWRTKYCFAFEVFWCFGNNSLI